MKKILFITLVFTISFYLSIEFIGDRLIKSQLQKNISTTLKRDVLIDKLNIDYLSGKANIKGISLLNKNFDGHLLEIETIKIDLDAFSLFSNDIVINDVLLEDITLNYYFNFSEQIISDNVRSLEKDLENNTSQSKSNKYFNIKNLDAKNISLSMVSPNLDIEKTFSLNDKNFKNVGNTSESKNYKDILKKVFNDTVDKVKDKVSIDDILENIENFDKEQLENKVKDKLKNKLKKLIN